MLDSVEIDVSETFLIVVVLDTLDFVEVELLVFVVDLWDVLQKSLKVKKSDFSKDFLLKNILDTIW